jgi:hypothetical protein
MQISPKTGASALFPVKFVKEDIDEAKTFGNGKGNFLKSIPVDKKDLKVLAKKGDYIFAKDTRKDVSVVIYKGKQISSGDFDSGADAWFMDIKGTKGQKSFSKASDVIDFFTKNKITEAVSVDRRTAGFKEALKRQKATKEKREAKKILDAKKQSKSDMAKIGANHEYGSDIDEILKTANGQIMGETAVNVASSGAVDMNPTGKNKKDEKENPMAKYGY